MSTELSTGPLARNRTQPRLGEQERALKAGAWAAENHPVRTTFVLVLATGLALGILGAGPSTPLPRGNDHFRLGMLRSQVDSAVAARGLSVISNGTAFLVCASDDPRVDYEQYSLFRAPHGTDYLWKVTIGYRFDASAADFAAVREELRRQLGEPTTDTRDADGASSADGSHPPAQQAIWADASTAVQLGARWTGAPDPSADRMLVSWTDRRLQRLVEARRKKDKTSASN